MTGGHEVLIVDKSHEYREGLRNLLDAAGYMCTAVGRVVKAQELVQSKFFPVVLVDLDVETPGSGAELVRAIKELSRPSICILLTNRRSFEGAVEALRLGCADIVLKQPDQEAPSEAGDRNRLRSLLKPRGGQRRVAERSAPDP